MSKKKLVIVSASSRVRREPPKQIPAIERYDGPYFRVLRKHIREGTLVNTDILILSEGIGLIWSSDTIGFHEPHTGPWGCLSLNKRTIDKMREENLSRIKRIANNYSEIYVNVGHSYMRLIEGFEDLVTCKVTYAQGNGLGSKARHMKNWILSKTMHA